MSRPTRRDRSQNSYLVVNSSQLAVFNSTAARLYRDAPATRQFDTDMFKDVTPVHADFIGEDWPDYEDFSDPVWDDQKADASNRTALCAQMTTSAQTPASACTRCRSSERGGLVRP